MNQIVILMSTIFDMFGDDVSVIYNGLFFYDYKENVPLSHFNYPVRITRILPKYNNKKVIGSVVFCEFESGNNCKPINSLSDLKIVFPEEVMITLHRETWHTNTNTKFPVKNTVTANIDTIIDEYGDDTILDINGIDTNENCGIDVFYTPA